MVSDKVAILNDGKLVRFGTVDELTINKQIYEIKTEIQLPESLITNLSNKYKIKLDEKSLILEITDNQDLNKFMDEIRKEGANITAVNQKKTSLEDLFIKSVIKSED